MLRGSRSVAYQLEQSLAAYRRQLAQQVTAKELREPLLPDGGNERSPAALKRFQVGPDSYE